MLQQCGDVTVVEAAKCEALFALVRDLAHELGVALDHFFRDRLFGGQGIL